MHVCRCRSSTSYTTTYMSRLAHENCGIFLSYTSSRQPATFKPPANFLSLCLVFWQVQSHQENSPLAGLKNNLDAMPPPGCRVFAGFLADHGPHNIANVPALLPSYIALAAVLTDRNNELNFQREEMLQERACKLPSPLSWPNQEFCYQIHQSTDTIPFCMDYFNWFFMYQF